MSRETPYSRLLTAARQFDLRVRNPKRIGMFFYPAAKLSEGWSLVDLNERVKAAEQLGFDVRLVAKEDGLHVQYVKRPDEIEYSIW